VNKYGESKRLTMKPQTGKLDNFELAGCAGYWVAAIYRYGHCLVVAAG